MTDINNGGAQRFGAEEQQRSVDIQRQANAGGDKCDVIVVLSPTSNTDDVQSLDSNGDLQSFNFVGVKSHDRLVQLLEHVSPANRGQNSAWHIFQPSSGVPANIVSVNTLENNYASRIVSYSVNMTVNEMRSLLSRALFDIAGEGDLNDAVAKAGIFAIYLIENKQAVNVVREIEHQFEMLRNQHATVSVADISDEELEQPVLNWRELPGANNFVLVEGVKRAFVMQNMQGQLVTFSNSVIGENNVAPQNKAPAVEAVDLDDEQLDETETEITGKAWLGYQADQLTIEQKSEALIAVGGYDLTDWEEEAIDEAFLAEQEKYLEAGEGQEDDAEEEDGEEDEDEGESESDNESEDEEEAAFDAADVMSDLLDEAQYDRANLKRVIIILGGACLKSDNEETLTAKILANIAERELDEADFVELLEDTIVAGMNERNADASVFTAWLDAGQEEDGDDEQDADEEDESESDEDEDEDEDESEEEEDSEEAAFADPLDAFEYDGAQLEPQQRIDALEALGVSTEGLNAIQVMKLFRAKQAENGLNTHEEEDEAEEGESEIRVLLATADDTDLGTILDLIGVPYDIGADHDELIELIENSGDEDEHVTNLNTAALTYGLDASQVEGVTYEDTLAAFLLAYFSAYQGDDLDDEDEEVEEDSADFESIGEQIVQAAGEANVDTGANPLGLSVENDSAKFLTPSEMTAAGQLMAIDMPQSLIINFTLTDRSTFEDSEELADVDGLNYRFPFNNPKSEEKARGSMYQPAATMIEILQRSATPRFLVDQNTFDVEAYSEKLNNLFNGEISATLYQGLLEDGEDPREVGVKVGDFIDDELLEDDDIDPSYWKDFVGHDMAMHTFINGHIGVRPVTVEERNSVLCLGVLNVALPGIWSVNGKRLPQLVDAAINAVKALVAENSKIQTYVAFTMSSGSLAVDRTLFEVIDHVRDNYEEVFSYSSADCAVFEDNEDVLEIASSLDNMERLPLEVLSSGYAAKTFENGGDLTLLIPCFESDEDEEDEADEGDDE